MDIAAVGKSEAHFFENLRINHVSNRQREKEILLDTNCPSSAKESW